MKEKIDEIEQMLEHILENDPRTFKDRECENGWLFDRVYQVLKKVKELECELI